MPTPAAVFALDWRWSEGRTERLPTLALELVQLKVDIIVVAGTQATRAAKDATSTIPIVMAVSGYPRSKIDLDHHVVRRDDRGPELAVVLVVGRGERTEHVRHVRRIDHEPAALGHPVPLEAEVHRGRAGGGDPEAPQARVLAEALPGPGRRGGHGHGVRDRVARREPLPVALLVLDRQGRPVQRGDLEEVNGLERHHGEVLRGRGDRRGGAERRAGHEENTATRQGARTPREHAYLNEIGAVYLGCRINLDIKTKLIHLLSSNTTAFQARKAPDKFKLEFDVI